MNNYFYRVSGMGITREILRANRDVQFIYGDNLLGRGLGGQARACRGEPNGFGIPTKRSPCRGDTCFMSDGDYLYNIERIEEAMDSVDWTKPYYIIPGIGEGRAELYKRAPRIYKYLTERLSLLYPGNTKIGILDNESVDG